MHASGTGQDVMAGRSTGTCQPAGDGPVQRPDSEPPLVTRSAQHGAGMGNPAQSPTGAGRHADRNRDDVEGVRSPCGRCRRQQGEPREEEQLAPLGSEQGVGREPLHPEGHAEVNSVAPPRGSVCTGSVLKLLEYQQYRCALTGRRLTPEVTALDHIVPIRQGGEHVIENTQVLHKEVNRAKGSLSNEEFLAMCREVVRWSDSAARKDAGS